MFNRDKDQSDTPDRRTVVSGRDGAKSRKIIIAAVVLIIVILVVLLLMQGAKSPQKGSGNYIDSDMKATASLEMAIKYKPDCTGKKDCDPNKPTYDFKVFVFDKTGTQVRVIRGDDKGVFKTSLPEGDYILVVAKAIKDEGLPQETVSLKNGKTLKLAVDYGTEVR